MLRVSAARPLQWHIALAEHIAATGASVEIDPVANAPGLPPAVVHLFELERLVHRLPNLGSLERAETTSLARYPRSAELPDRILDLTGSLDSPQGAWRMEFDGVPGEAALAASLFAGAVPTIALVEATSGAVVRSARPGILDGRGLATAMGDILARATTLVGAVLGGAVAQSVPYETQHAPPVERAQALRRLVRSLPRVAAGRLYHLCCNAPHWRIGWRFVKGPDVIDLQALPKGGWSILPDDGRRFYADPFPFAHKGQTILFVEDFQHRLGYGVISAVAFDEYGPAGRPEVVLDLSYHLSYPFVFEHRGDVWMIPESSAAGTVELFRATKFPGGWVREATLLTDIIASDATLWREAGRWWMFATVRDGGGAFSDALHLWWADEIEGVWTPHPMNPVLIDIASARPAGRMVRRAGRLIRPVQDCTVRYGGAMALAQVEELSRTTYRQSVMAHLAPGKAWAGRNLHTLNRAGALECIDGSAIAFRRPW